MRRARLALTAGLAAGLAGCAGPNVATTSVAPVTPPVAWRTDADRTAPLQRDWWQSFGDPTLAALVDKALANNSDIGVAAARVREARANFALARAQTLPTIDAAIGGGRSRSVSRRNRILRSRKSRSPMKSTCSAASPTRNRRRAIAGSQARRGAILSSCRSPLRRRATMSRCAASMRGWRSRARRCALDRNRCGLLNRASGGAIRQSSSFNKRRPNMTQRRRSCRRSNSPSREPKMV